MADKPSPIVRRGQHRQVRDNVREAESITLRRHGNPEMIQAAMATWSSDIESGQAQRGRYSRVRESIMQEYHCSHDAAEDAIRGMRAYNAERHAGDIHLRVAEISEQLQRIADDNEKAEPSAAVAALRELGKLNGLYAPKKLEIAAPEQTPADVQAQLRATIDALSPAGRDHLEAVLLELDALKASGAIAFVIDVEAN